MIVEIDAVGEIGKAAEIIIPMLRNHPVVAFHGPMGAGKTTLIREICRQLGVKDPVASPTFALVNQYADGGGRNIYHFDFYRIARLEEALDFGVEEYLDSGDICLIEWPEKIEPLLPENLLIVSIEPRGTDNEWRTIGIRAM